MSIGEKNERTPLLNWVQIASGALAAISSAVLLSTLGVAGTLVGAALGSVVASVGSTLYTRGIDASRQQVASQAAALRRVTSARSRLDEAVSAMQRGESGAQSRVQRADRDLDEAEQALHDSVEGGTADEQDVAASAVAGAAPARRSWRDLPWKHIGIVAAGVFVVAMVTITAFELSTGRAVSSYTGGSDPDTGSTVPGLSDSRDDPEQEPEGEPTGTPSATPTDEATEEPTEEPSEEPTEEPTPSETPTEATPSETPTETSEPSPTAPTDDPQAAG